MAENEQQETLHFLDYWRVIQSRKEVVIAVFLLVVVTGVLVTFNMSRYYRASCVIAVEQQETLDVEVFSRNISRYDPLFLRTQYEIIQSRPVIEDAIRKLNLNDRLSKAYGYEMLPPDKAFERTLRIVSSRMRVQQYRDTNLIEIRLDMAEPKDSAPREAAALANTVADVFRGLNMTRFRQGKERALAALHDSYDERAKMVDRLEGVVEDIRQEYELDVISPYAGSSGSLDKFALTRMEELRIRTMLELEDKKARWHKIQSMGEEELLAVAPLLVGDQALQQLVASKRTAEVEFNTLTQARLGPKHPDVQRVQAAINELDTKVQDALRALKVGVQAHFEAAQSKMDALTTMLEVSRATERTLEAGGYRKFQKAQEELMQAKKIRDALEARYIQEQIELRIPRTAVEVIEMAKAPDVDAYISPNIVLNILLSIVLGLGAGIGLAYFIEYLDTSLKTVEEIERFMDVSVIGVIPQKVKPFCDPASDTRHAESYRVLRANIQFSDKFKGSKTLCVTSGSVGEGKSLTIYNLGHICAQLGDRTIIIDSDLHRPRQHKILGVSNKVGLANILIDEVTVDDAIMETGTENLHFLPSGKVSSGVHGLLDSQRMTQLIEEMKTRYDLVLLDAPPMIGVSDASTLVRDVSGVLLVVQHRKYPRTVSKRAKDMVENVGGNLVGVVLNNINISKDYSYYYHHYYYSSSQPSEAGDKG